MFDYLWSKTIATILWPLHVLPTKFVYKKIGSAIGIQKTAKSRGGSLPAHIEKFYEFSNEKVTSQFISYFMMARMCRQLVWKCRMDMV
uniref:Uncharacterized protein n=1 Tax=Gossypium raimondii TaxID=29730 RepID=A0A0D2N5X2_GOSRA|nr:hypothetical protein B456_005G0004002 [Gossypium raimondii]